MKKLISILLLIPFLISCDEYKKACRSGFDIGIKTVSKRIAEKYECDWKLVLADINKVENLACGKKPSQKTGGIICEIGAVIASKALAYGANKRWKCNQSFVEKDLTKMTSVICKFIQI